MPPPSPHFDDEATLLTARAVVPINRAVDRGNIRSYLVKVAIIVAAALMGAAAALSVDFFQNRRQAAAAVVVEPSAPATQGTVSETLDTAQTSPPQSSGATVSANTTKASSAGAQSDSSVTPPPAMKEMKETKETKPATDRNEIQEQSARSDGAADRRNVVGKRSEPMPPRHRAAKVQRSNDSGQNVERPRDVGRIREIFEGPSPF